jgi:hypothetical protein
MNARRERWKRLGPSSDQGQEMRRQEAMERQRQARRDLTMHVRALACGMTTTTESKVESDLDDIVASMEMEMMEIDDASSSSGRNSQKKNRREHRIMARKNHYCNQLMHPEWMVDIPSDLNGATTAGHRAKNAHESSLSLGGWFVLPRPDGKRCLVIASKYARLTTITNECFIQAHTINDHYHPHSHHHYRCFCMACMSFIDTLSIQTRVSIESLLTRASSMSVEISENIRGNISRHRT